MESLKHCYLPNNLLEKDSNRALKALSEGNFDIFKSYCVREDRRPVIRLMPKRKMRDYDLKNLIDRLELLKTKIYYNHHCRIYGADKIKEDVKLVSLLTEILFSCMISSDSFFDCNDWSNKFIIVGERKYKLSTEERWNKFMKELYEDAANGDWTS